MFSPAPSPSPPSLPTDHQYNPLSNQRASRDTVLIIPDFYRRMRATLSTIICIGTLVLVHAVWPIFPTHHLQSTFFSKNKSQIIWRPQVPSIMLKASACSRKSRRVPFNMNLHSESLKWRKRFLGFVVPDQNESGSAKSTSFAPRTLLKLDSTSRTSHLFKTNLCRSVPQEPLVRILHIMWNHRSIWMLECRKIVYWKLKPL